MSSQKEGMDAAKAYVCAHLQELCREVVTWSKTGFLSETARLWEVSEILQLRARMSADLRMAEQVVCRMAVERIAEMERA